MKVFGPEYQKIQTVFKRDERKVIVPWDYTLPEFELLAGVLWDFTEKIDGTNIRIHFNGERVTIGGRTDNAQVPTFLLAELQDLLDPGEFKTAFDTDVTDVTLYGEGFGKKIQSGEHYGLGDRHDFALFDVRVGPWWLSREDVRNVAEKMRLNLVPVWGRMTLEDAIEETWHHTLVSAYPGATMEGLVGVPTVPLYNRKGDRIITKIKVKDFADYERKKAQ